MRFEKWLQWLRSSGGAICLVTEWLQLGYKLVTNGYGTKAKIKKTLSGSAIYGVTKTGYGRNQRLVTHLVTRFGYGGYSGYAGYAFGYRAIKNLRGR